MMHTEPAILKGQLDSCEDQLKALSTYVSELKIMTAKHDTPKDQYASDMAEAMHNIGYYENEIARLQKELVNSLKVASPGTGPGTLLPKTRNQGIGAAVLSSISFVAGAFLGSRLKSGKSSKDRQSGN